MSDLRALDTTATSTTNQPWPVKDIVYVGVVGAVMLAALLEWILWLLAFLYCLIKAFQKADRELLWSTRILALLNMVFFVAMRCVFLPIMVVTLPLPAQVVQHFPEEVVEVLQLFAFWAFAGLLTIPWLFCVYQLITHNVGRAKKIKTVLDEYSAPKVVIIMPCYNEEPSVLLRTVDSIVDCDYPPSCMHIFLSFDGDKVNELYLNTLEQLGVTLRLDAYPSSIGVAYRGCRVTVSRFPHGGKRSCQKRSFKLIDRIYAEYLRRNDNLFLLLIDSDCILDRHCVSNFMYEMQLKPSSKCNMLAMTGVITSTTEKNTLLTVLQDMEYGIPSPLVAISANLTDHHRYIHGQLFERSVESGCGAVTCLPGALTMLRFSAFRKMAKYYFADKAEHVNDLFDYGKCHLGEDRWLTHLFMIGAKERYQIQMNTGAFCKTEAVQTFNSLLKQRRRWFLGFITNEVCMLTDIRLWKRYPLLLIIRLAQNTIRTTALLFFIMVISILTTSQKVANLPIGFIAVSLGLNWLLMLFFGLKLGRLKVTMYPLMFVLNPFLNWLYMVYGIFTAGQRTWGGPRADAGKADEHTTAAQAIEQAKMKGDDLNVVPETFGKHSLSRHNTLLPSRELYGRFTPAQELPGGWYRQAEREVRAPWADDNLPYRYDRNSFDSTDSVSSIRLPRRIESIFDDPKDALAYREQQNKQKAAGGAHFESREVRPGTGLLDSNTAAYDSFEKEARLTRASFESVESRESVPLHCSIPRRVPPRVDRGSSAHRNSGNMGPDRIIVPPPRSHQPGPRRSAHRDNSPGQNGKSPLARKSFTRLASPPPPAPISMTAADVIELERIVAARNSEEMARRGRSRDPVPRPPKKLSKQPRGSRSSSRA
ncbi:hypothetical protein LTR56_000276 [Elasticomyces elasticus]|nr:hypothetical protein LTR56_000276 [Elasticomyces elasticus]KAK3667029.1 hypothetical protein LTR22_002254 [Elasticomyces elasticus]KAK4911712.1 hypothetical protein LTR49_019791 [Elasticomyces elasticus]KAK5751290.1 hypothetical protein LTS12_018606 [Elasticomyces elasticus]